MTIMSRLRIVRSISARVAASGSGRSMSVA
jgi:hypothetical protein